MSFDEQDKLRNKLKDQHHRQYSFLGVDDSINEDILGENENDLKTKASTK